MLCSCAEMWKSGQKSRWTSQKWMVAGAAGLLTNIWYIPTQNVTILATYLNEITLAAIFLVLLLKFCSLHVMCLHVAKVLYLHLLIAVT